MHWCGRHERWETSGSPLAGYKGLKRSEVFGAVTSYETMSAEEQVTSAQLLVAAII